MVWERFAEHECRGYSPLYEQISRAVAVDSEVLALLDGRPAAARQPNLLLAAVHYLLLSGVTHPLADIYAGVSSADPVPLFHEFCLEHRDAIEALLASRRTQTNECGRSAAILPALAWTADRLGEPLALLDVGASAGLNLLCDEFHIDYGDAGATGPAHSPVRVDCRIVAGRPPIRQNAPGIVARRGIDRAPIDIHDSDETRWLLACVWPDTGRLERTSAAIQLARERTPTVLRGDAVADLAATINSFPEQATACVMTTWTFAYLDADQRRAFVVELERVGRRRPLVWISAEGPGVIDLFDATDPPAHDLTMPSVLGAVVIDQTGATAITLGWVHPHGRWIDWQAAHATNPSH